MTKAYLSYNNIVSPLGFSSEAVVANVETGVSGIRLIEDKKLLPIPFYASLINTEDLELRFKSIHTSKAFTKLEKMMLLSLSDTIDRSKVKFSDRTGLIISTTKGNIHTLEKRSNFAPERAYLGTLGVIIQEFFGFQNEAIVVSNACVSGLLAINIAKRYIQNNIYDHVFVVSGDIVSKFILSGFNSFQAMGSLPCRPFTKGRDGITIGEAAASVLVTSNKTDLPEEAVEILGEASCNDANHISGPSRTGEGLFRAVTNAMTEAKVKEVEIDYISAHGTATQFNDEMEAIAFSRLGLNMVPLNSLKGYFGHTMGASGMLETIIGMHSLKNNMLYQSVGYMETGTSRSLNIIESNTKKELRTFLKSSSGFGGSNTATVFKKYI